jgi:RecB family exonuclease
LVEEYLESPLTLNNGNTVKIRGKADRVEKWKNYWVIIDLKTGAFKSDQINFKAWNDLLDSKKKKKKPFSL